MLTKISRKAFESKLQDYQKDSWLFLSSLSLDSFSFGSKLPQVKQIRPLQRGPGSIALVVDIEYEGGIEVGLQAAVALNIRDFHAKLSFKPSTFKLIVKCDTAPTPRISFMLSEMPEYSVNVLMRGQELQRASNLIHSMLGNFIKNRVCFPNYLTLLIRQTEKSLVQIATEKQFQSQLRLRVTTLHVNPANPNVLGDPDALQVMCAISFGECSSRTDTISTNTARWNSIHSFNIFNGLSESPENIQIIVYQVITGDSMNVLGKVEIPYESIKAGILDVRQVAFAEDAQSSISIELFLHHMQEDGELDVPWIFWNCPRPRKRFTTESHEQINWRTIKYIIARLSSDDHPHIEEEFLSFESDELGSNSPLESPRKTMPVLPMVVECVDWTLKQLKERILRKRRDTHDQPANDDSDPLASTVKRALSILQAFKLELDDFTCRFDLNREPLSQAAQSEHNKRLAGLIFPLVKSFLSGLLDAISFLRKHPKHVESHYYVREERLEVLETRIQSLWKTLNQIKSGKSLVDDFYEQPNESSSSEELIPMAPKTFFNCFWSDLPVQLSLLNNEISIQSRVLDHSDRPVFDFEGIFYTRSDGGHLNLSSNNLFESLKSWEVSLIGRALFLIPFGKNHSFPERIIPLEHVETFELVKDRGAFHLGFNADLSAEESLKHANNAVLRLKGHESLIIELIGDSRSCDQFYCLMSARLGRESSFKFPLARLLSCWLMPLSVPAYSTTYALALNLDNCTFILGNFDDSAIHEAFCQLKQSLRPASNLLTLEGSRMLQSHSLSSFTSSMSSVSSSQSSSALESRNRYHRISFHVPQNGIRMSALEATPIVPDWVKAAFGTRLGDSYHCTVDGNWQGRLLIADQYLVFWSPPIVIALPEIKTARKSGELGVEINLQSKARHLLLFDSPVATEQFLESLLL